MMLKNHEEKSAVEEEGRSIPLSSKSEVEILPLGNFWWRVSEWTNELGPMKPNLPDSGRCGGQSQGCHYQADLRVLLRYADC